MTINSPEGISIAVAIDKDKNSQHAVRWTVENHLNKNSRVVLLHVLTQASQTPQEAVPKDGRAPTESEMQQFFLSYRGYCARKGVPAVEVVLNDIEVTSALVDYVKINSISIIVVGNSSRNALSRAFRNPDVPSSLSRTVPDFCSVYAISKGKVQNLRSASRSPMPSSSASVRPPSPQPGYLSDNQSEDCNRCFFSQGSWRSGGSEIIPFDRSSETSLFSDRSIDYMMTNPADRHPGGKIPSPQPSVNNRVHTKSSPLHPYFNSDASDFSGSTSFYSSDFSFEELDPSGTSEDSRSTASTQIGGDIEDEVRRIKYELKQTMEMYNSACKEAMNANRKAREINQWKSAEACKLEEAKQAREDALAMVDVEKQKCKAAMEAAQMAQRLAELEIQKRKNAERKAKQEAEEMKRAMDALTRTEMQYRKYKIEDVKVATDNFSDSAKIGEGGYGTVYKASLDHTPVAIKVLRPDIQQGQEQFQKEIEVLSCMRHPNMVLLLGACPENGCLVYEYMEKGSLEDRLFRKDDTPPIPWRSRFRIAAEIATALLFLHQAKPEPLVHRDIKPANILLDGNYVSKISDVGLARLVPSSVADSVTQYHMTAAAGTFFYIDPEYQQTGMLGTKSDIFSLGVMLLQIITAKPPVGISHHVSRAIDRGNILEALDPSVTGWPVEEVKSFANLALQCCELRKKDRPDLGKVIVPELNRIRGLVSDDRASYIDGIACSVSQHTTSFEGSSYSSQEG